MNGVALDGTTLSRWRSDPLSFITEVLFDPETGKPFTLLEAEREFMTRAFMLDADGRLMFPELVYARQRRAARRRALR